MDAHGFDMEQEFRRRTDEDDSGVTKTMSPRQETQNEESDTNQSTDTDVSKKVGRPTLTNDERQSDPADALTGRQPKPSSPDGSL